jgi:hypothetical protein
MISRQQRPTGSILRIFSEYLLSSIWLVFIVSFQAQGQPPPSNPTAPAPQEQVITVWKVGSRDFTPDTAIDPDLAAKAGGSGYKLQVEAVPATDFASAFVAAFERNQQPDILMLYDVRVIAGLATAPGTRGGRVNVERIGKGLVEVTESLAGLEAPRPHGPREPRFIAGWELLSRTSRSFEAARSLALQPAECGESSQNQLAPGGLQSAADSAARAYLERASALHEIEDADRLHTGTGDSREPQELFPLRPFARSDIHTPLVGELHVTDTKVCGHWGNDHLAFVQTVSTYESENALGHLTLLLVFRNEQGQWRLLTASTDPVSNTEFVKEIPKLTASIQNPWNPDSKPMPAKLLSPEDGRRPEPPAGKRFGDFTWQPSTSTDVVAEIAEFGYKDDARLFVRFLSADHSASQAISSGLLWWTLSLWQWRVWSISGAGAVSFSESRSFRQ